MKPKHKNILKIVIIAVVVLLVATVLGCGCTGGISRLGAGAACGCMPGLRKRSRDKEDFSFGKVGEFMAGVGSLAALGVADVVGSSARWAAGETMDGMRHVGGAIEGKAVHPIDHGSFWIW